MARDTKNDLDKTGVPSRRRRRSRANSTLDLNQTSGQQLQARHDTTADPPPIRGADATVITPTLSPGSPNSPNGATDEFASISPYGRSYLECACHHLAECPGLIDVESHSNSRKLLSSVSAGCWRRTLL